MTQVLYRVGDEIISSYEQYLEKKGTASPSYMFLAEGLAMDEKYSTFEEYVNKSFRVVIPNRMN